MKVVLDTNVWISSLLLTQSISGQIVAAWQQAHFETVISEPILDEIGRVVNYPKIQKRLLVTQEDIHEYLTFLRLFADVVKLDSSLSFPTKVRDINDDPILATLLVSQSDYLVTGDQDLLVLSEKYPIITPKKFGEFLN